MDQQDRSPQELPSLEELLGEDLDFLMYRQEEAQEEQPQETPAAEPDPPADKPRASASRKNGKPNWQKSLLLYLHDFTFLLAGILIVFLLLFRVVVVSGTSMNNTLLDGDYLLLLGNTIYKTPRQGDVIVASKSSFDNGTPIVKRVIATEGQMVYIDFEAGVVYVDGIALEEPYTLTPTNMEEGMSFPQVVQEGCVFVMGDNRNESKDSRNPQIGQIDCREVLGKVIFLFLPGTNNGEFARDFGRIGGVS